jgi:hypothetical protein
LAFLKVVRAARIELARPRTTDFLTTSIFIAISVRGLEYTFTIAIALGVARLLSTPSLSSLHARTFIKQILKPQPPFREWPCKRGHN